MSDLLYASIVIVIIWAGIFLWVFRLDRRLHKLEKALTGDSKSAEPPPSEPATEPAAASEVELNQGSETTVD